jgi:hypothetical protein
MGGWWFHAFSGDRAIAFWIRADRAGSALPLGNAVKAMGYGDDEANEAIRLSGCHLMPEVEWDADTARVVVTVRTAR